MPVIKDTVLRLQELGVDEFRIMNVEPSLRWRANAGGQTIGITEWLDYICGLLDWWYDNDIKMDLNVWSFWRGAAGSRYINIIPDGHGSCQREDKIPACRDACKPPISTATAGSFSATPSQATQKPRAATGEMCFGTICIPFCGRDRSSTSAAAPSGS